MGYKHGVLTEVAKERHRQDAKWGEQNHPNGTGEHGAGYGLLDVTGTLAQAFGGGHAAYAKNACDAAARKGEVTYAHILFEEVAEAFAESDPAKLRAELVQVAAVAVAWVEAIDRQHPIPSDRHGYCEIPGCRCPWSRDDMTPASHSK